MVYVSVVGSNPWSYLHPVLESVLGSRCKWEHDFDPTTDTSTGCKWDQ